jgi:flagellin
VKDAEGRSIDYASGSSALQYWTDLAKRDAWVSGDNGANAPQVRASAGTVGGEVTVTQITAGSQTGAVASETKFSIASLAAKTHIKLTLDNQNFEFTTTAVSTSSTTNMDLLVSNMQADIRGVAGYQDVSVTRNGLYLYVRDSAGRDIGALVGGTDTNYGTSSTATEISQGLPPTVSSAVFSGSARLNDTQIKTQTGANQAVARLDNAMANVDHELATFGSVMNRLTFAGDNLTNVSQNTQQSRSRVLDTDYAVATTELARTQIIQQAGMAMLAQANQQPQTVLSLLQ